MRLLIPVVQYAEGTLRAALTVGITPDQAADFHEYLSKIDLHSAIYGGTVPNSLHVLMRSLQPLLPNEDGTLRDELRAGIDPIPDAERAMWNNLPSGDRAIERVGGRKLHA